MGEITSTVTTTTGVRCDKRGCAAVFMLDEPEVSQDILNVITGHGSPAIAEAAPLEGWSFWVGRNAGWRCPDHPVRTGKAWCHIPPALMAVVDRG